MIIIKGKSSYKLKQSTMFGPIFVTVRFACSIKRKRKRESRRERERERDM